MTKPPSDHAAASASQLNKGHEIGCFPNSEESAGKPTSFLPAVKDSETHSV